MEAPSGPYEKRMRRWEKPSASRFITFSCYDRLPLLNNPLIMDLFVSQLVEARRRHGLRLFAWVVMPEHVHLLVRAEGSAWSHVAQLLKTNVSKRVLARWRSLGEAGERILTRVTVNGKQRFWQHGGGFDRTIRDAEEFCKTVRYIHMNPVERKLVQRPADWRWSSVRWWMRLPGEVECDPPPGELGWWEGWKGFVDAEHRAEDTIMKT